ncbi:MAG: hypothetical protein HN580_25935 [Deltaproteobacteria bacterium]|jgi:endonuclease/exonuclease/phosphatase (EEP) superfamily protein YafD|nr:hypothetical protein [Deltaproteobacteria bacterium]MBT4090186.1 hypothetical protein [Deltaproteobacteria bacterium]MBT4264873.1 hypothetical protein [Deltaproteobacteria bacterium]MBT4640041.1 hypothetical protein [Deltaproteobacteria bacterium]MBT6610512.1 hypothetical protein [Deltaproteobacteria bacterium]
MIRNAIRFLGGTFGCLILLAMMVWVMVYFNYFPIDSKINALGFFPPYGFVFFVLPLVLLFWMIGARKSSTILLLVFLLFFISFGDFSFNSAETSKQPELQKGHKLSVIALNVRYYSYDLKKVITAIKDMDADLYLLSENILSIQERHILEKELQPWTFHMGRQEGTALISRLPVLDFKEVVLPSKQASLSEPNKISNQHLNPNRSFVHARIDVGGTPVHAISIRFLAGRPADRTLSEAFKWGIYVFGVQLKEIDFFLDYLKNLRGPIVFGGDLNATPSSLVVQKLSKIAVDSYLEKHIWGGFTFWTQFPSYARLDYIFSMNGVRVLSSEILDVVVSDHFPVYSEFMIPSPQVM